MGKMDKAQDHRKPLCAPHLCMGQRTRSLWPCGLFWQMFWKQNPMLYALRPGWESCLSARLPLPLTWHSLGGRIDPLIIVHFILLVESQDIPVGNFCVCGHSHLIHFLPSACSESKGSCSRREEDGRREKSGVHLSLCSLLSSSSGFCCYQDSHSNLRWLQLSGLPEYVSSLPFDP